ncbi:MAG: hypothetical protein ABH854_01295 [Candidatus Diapherotrites archaeon]|nr:hypothetical protein [Candidatus Micrarchaeota archaeon]MBU1939847.1 hypothetical protein [Candidatus Micrarchaeota archaeon]
MIEFGEWQNIELKVGIVQSAEEIEGKDKLYKLTVDVGEEEPRTLVAGIKQFRTEEEMKGKQIIVVANLRPANIGGIESNGMLLAVGKGADDFALLTTDKEAKAGTRVE